MVVKFNIDNPLSEVLKNDVVSILSEGFVMMREERETRKVGEGNYLGIFLHDCFLEVMGKKFPLSQIIQFKRWPYRGRIVCIPSLKITISFVSKYSVKKALKRSLTKPHYLQALIYHMNKNFVGMEQQGCLFSPDELDVEQLDTVFTETYGESAIDLDNYTHYVVEYTSYRGHLQDVNLSLYSSGFGLVNSWSLKENIPIDVGELTEVVKNDTELEHDNKTKGLVKKKKGVDLWKKKQELESEGI